MKRAGPEATIRRRPDRGSGSVGGSARTASSHGTHARGPPSGAARRAAFAKDIMTKKMLIDATHAEETRVVVVDGTRVDEFDFESLNKRQLAGNIYLAKVTRVEPSLQAAFVDYGGNRHGFLAFSEIHPDYYQIPEADREALLAEEAALAREADEEAAARSPRPARPHPHPPARAASRPPKAPRPPRTPSSSPSRRARGRGRGPRRRAAALGGRRRRRDRRVRGARRRRGRRRPAPTHDHEHDDDADRPATTDGYEAVGGDDVAEERAPRKPLRQRRYKIQEVIKVRQIMLVQVVKEERGNKGAALTTYLSPRRPLLRADAQHRARRRHLPQDHQRRRPQEAQGNRLRDRRAGRRRPHHPHRRRQPHQDRDQARLRIPAAPVGADPRPDAEVDRPRADLRGRRPDQARDPRPLQPRDRRDPRRRRARLPRGQGLHEDAHAVAREEREALRRRRCRCSRASRSRATWARCSTRPSSSSPAATSSSA